MLVRFEFGFLDLFVIWDLNFGIYIRQNTSLFPCPVKNVGNDEAFGMAVFFEDLPAVCLEGSRTLIRVNSRAPIRVIRVIRGPLFA